MKWTTSRFFAQPFVQAQIRETSKLRATGLCEVNPPVTGGFPSHRASNAENVSIWWRHHACMVLCIASQLWTHSVGMKNLGQVSTEPRNFLFIFNHYMQFHQNYKILHGYPQSKDPSTSANYKIVYTYVSYLLHIYNAPYKYQTSK